MLEKGMIHVLDWIKHDSMKFHHTPQNGLKIKTYALPVFRMSVEYFQVVKNKTMDQGTVYPWLCQSNFIYNALQRVRFWFRVCSLQTSAVNGMKSPEWRESGLRSSCWFPSGCQGQIMSSHRQRSFFPVKLGSRDWGGEMAQCLGTYTVLPKNPRLSPCTQGGNEALSRTLGCLSFRFSSGWESFVS